jgi:hypothetical protein
MASSLLALIMLGGYVGGCTSGSPPEPTPGLGPRYDPVSRGLCERIRTGEIATQFELNVPASFDPSGNYFADSTYWRTSCWFDAVAEDDRFATHVSRFGPGGPILLTVFQDVADAANAYRLGALGFEEDREPLDATVASSRGWWDQGQSREYVQNEGRSEDIAIDLYGIDVAYVVRHENLYMEAHLDALVYLEDVGEVSDVLHDMVRALMEETVSHLTLTS